MKDYTSTSSSHIWLHMQVSKLDESNPTITSPHLAKRGKTTTNKTKKSNSRNSCQRTAVKLALTCKTEGLQELISPLSSAASGP